MQKRKLSVINLRNDIQLHWTRSLRNDLYESSVNVFVGARNVFYRPNQNLFYWPHQWHLCKSAILDPITKKIEVPLIPSREIRG